jgi:hypothetical protein
VYQQQQQEQQEQQQEQQDAENPFLDPPFSRIKTQWFINFTSVFLSQLVSELFRSCFSTVPSADI